jgi:hypothetical protein
MQNTLNQDEKLSVWSPDVGFSNALGPFQTAVDEHTTGRLIKGSNYDTESYSSPLETALYDGSQNSILFTREYYFDFGCDFDLRSYPFDTQVTIFIPSLSTLIAM